MAEILASIRRIIAEEDRRDAIKERDAVDAALAPPPSSDDAAAAADAERRSDSAPGLDANLHDGIADTEAAADTADAADAEDRGAAPTAREPAPHLPEDILRLTRRIDYPPPRPDFTSMRATRREGVPIMQLHGARRETGERAAATNSAPRSQDGAPTPLHAPSHAPATEKTPASPAAGAAGRDAPEPRRPRLLSADKAAHTARSFSLLRDRVAEADAAADADTGQLPEQLVETLIVPLLRNWMDANLPAMVEKLVRAEIDRIVAGDAEPR